MPGVVIQFLIEHDSTIDKAWRAFSSMSWSMFDAESTYQWVDLINQSLAAGIVATIITYGIYAQYYFGRRLTLLQISYGAMSVMLLGISTYVISEILITAGFLLLVIPGLVALCMFWVTVSACIFEKCGPIHAIRRSYHLTNGRRWRIFWILLILIVVTLLVEELIQKLALALTPETTPEFVFTLWSWFIFCIYTVIYAVINTCGYYILTHEKEHLPSDQYAKVFE